MNRRQSKPEVAASRVSDINDFRFISPPAPWVRMRAVCVDCVSGIVRAPSNCLDPNGIDTFSYRNEKYLHS